MKKIHMEFDLVVTDMDAQDLFDTPATSLKDCILFGLEIFDEYENIENFKMEEVKKQNEAKESAKSFALLIK